MFKHKNDSGRPYKSCPLCDAVWNDRNDFITDAKITLVGYQANFANLEKGKFLFAHICGAELEISVDQLSDLYEGPVFEVSQAGQPECPGYCLHADELRPCPVECECAYVREILSLFI